MLNETIISEVVESRVIDHIIWNLSEENSIYMYVPNIEKAVVRIVKQSFCRSNINGRNSFAGNKIELACRIHEARRTSEFRNKAELTDKVEGSVSTYVSSANMQTIYKDYLTYS